MVTIIYRGRLGNNLFQYAAAYIFAQKFGFALSTAPPNSIFKLPTTTGIKKSDSHSQETIEVGDENFMTLLRQDNVKNANYKFKGFYQIKDFVLEYEDEIRGMFSLDHQEKNPSDVFVAYRIGDIVNLRQMLPIQYYQEALTKIGTKSGYITSDSPDHPNVKELSRQFNLKIYEDTADKTIDFAKDFDNLVLSEGSYSWWIGFLSKAKNVYYNDRERFWHGDIFVLPDWIPLSYDFKHSLNSQNQ